MRALVLDVSNAKTTILETTPTIHVNLQEGSSLAPLSWTIFISVEVVPACQMFSIRCERR